MMLIENAYTAAIRSLVRAIMNAFHGARLNGFSLASNAKTLACTKEIFRRKISFVADVNFAPQVCQFRTYYAM